MNDLSEHPFSPENILAEIGSHTDLEKGWLAWCDAVESSLGHDLDGNDPDFEHGVGYSLDEAYKKWSSGLSPQAYCALVVSRSRYQKPN